MTSPRATSPRTAGPMTTSARISPTMPGWRMRLNSSPSLAASRTTKSEDIGDVGRRGELERDGHARPARKRSATARDDDARFRALARALLERSGYTVAGEA